MTYAPVIPTAGYAGWAILKRTMAKQTDSFVKSPEIKRDEDYFRANIGKITTAEDLVKDRRLLKVALGAFGLGADIDNKAFIQKVLEGGTLDSTSLANKLADKQYLKMAAAFGFGDFAMPSTRISTFPDQILKDYKARSFEAAVGNQDGDLRLALNAERELALLARKTGSEDTKWYGILGNSALRQVFTKALGLPTSISSIDLDQQLTAFKDKAAAIFGGGGVSQFTDPGKVETLIRRFLIRSQADASATTVGAGAAALAMLQQTAVTMRKR
jgi:hypothetical protein